jgi:hypothetical protein
MDYSEAFSEIPTRSKRDMPSHGLPSPASTASLKRPLSPPTPFSNHHHTKRLRLTCKQDAFLTPSLDSAKSIQHAFFGNSFYTPSQTNSTFSLQHLDYTKKSSMGPTDANQDTKSRALKMIQYALSSNRFLKNNYIPVHILGWGGCGAVFEAKRRVDEKMVRCFSLTRLFFIVCHQNNVQIFKTDGNPC